MRNKQNMDSNMAVTGEENIYFEMESKAETDAAENYDDIVQRAIVSESAPPVPGRTSCEKCKHEAKNTRQALTEVANACHSNTVIIRRMWFILTVTVAVAFLTAVATLILVIMMMMARNVYFPSASKDCAAAQGRLWGERVNNNSTCCGRLRQQLRGLILSALHSGSSNPGNERWLRPLHVLCSWASLSPSTQGYERVTAIC